MTTFSRVALLVGLCFAAASVFCNAECKQVFDVREVIRSAGTLDGKIVCIRGVITPTQVPEWNSSLMQELAPIATKGRQRDDGKIGLVDWSPETGVSEEQYKPKSFDLLEPSAHGERASPLDATLRGAVMYKKSLRARVPPVHTNAPEVQSMRGARYDVEFVVLEIVRAGKLGGRKTEH